MERNRTDLSVTRELTLGEVLRILLAKMRWILVCGLAAAVLAGFVTKCFIAPTYSSYTTMYVYATQQSESVGSITNSDLVAAESLASTYREILQSNTVLASVCEYVNAEWTDNWLTSADLDKLVEVSTISDTQLLKIEVTTAKPELSQLIAKGFAAVGPTEIVRVTKAGGVEIVDDAVLPIEPDGPDLIPNTVLALAAGLMASAVFFLIRGIYDTTIYTEADLDASVALPILGALPVIEQSDEAGNNVWTMKGIEYVWD